MEGALIGGLLIIFFPEFLRRLDLPQDIGNIFFAIGAVQALSMGGTMAEDLRRGLSRLFGRSIVGMPQVSAMSGAIAPPALAAKARRALEIENLFARYGNVVELSGVSLALPDGAVVGLIGPNGAGKSTLIDAVTGFLSSYEGEVQLDGTSMEALQAHQRARAGIRGTWQTTRIAPLLSAGTYLTLAAGRSLKEMDAEELLKWTGCPAPETSIATIDAGTRRLLDVAGIIAAKPKIVLLDEPAAGLSHEESVQLAARIAQIPIKFGAAVLLVEHDMDLVRMACNSVTVIDFGKVIASGATREVLADPMVVKAYLDDAEEIAQP